MWQLSHLQMAMLAHLSADEWRSGKEVRAAMNAGRNWWFRCVTNTAAGFYARAWRLEVGGLLVGRSYTAQIGDGTHLWGRILRLTAAGQLVRQGLIEARVICESEATEVDGG